MSNENQLTTGQQLADRYKPLQNFLLCVEYVTNQTKSGLFIPDGVASRNNKRALVLAAGPGKTSGEPMNCKAGEVVLLPNSGYAEIMIEERPYYVLRDDAVMIKCVDQYAGV